VEANILRDLGRSVVTVAAVVSFLLLFKENLSAIDLLMVVPLALVAFKKPSAALALGLLLVFPEISTNMKYFVVVYAVILLFLLPQTVHWLSTSILLISLYLTLKSSVPLLGLALVLSSFVILDPLQSSKLSAFYAGLVTLLALLSPSTNTVKHIGLLIVPCEDNLLASLEQNPVKDAVTIVASFVGTLMSHNMMLLYQLLTLILSVTAASLAYSSRQRKDLLPAAAIPLVAIAIGYTVSYMRLYGRYPFTENLLFFSMIYGSLIVIMESVSRITEKNLNVVKVPVKADLTIVLSDNTGDLKHLASKLGLKSCVVVDLNKGRRFNFRLPSRLKKAPLLVVNVSSKNLSRLIKLAERREKIFVVTNDEDLTAKISEKLSVKNILDLRSQGWWSRIVGLQSLKSELVKSIIIPAKYPSGDLKAKNLLIVGPPGSGKTLILKALREKLRLLSFKIDSLSLASQNTLLKKSDRARVVLIDDLDLAFYSRENCPAIIKTLKELAEKYSIVATATDISVIPTPATGVFDQVLTIPPPTAEEIELFLEAYRDKLRGLNLSPSLLARYLEGMYFGDIVKVIEELARLSAYMRIRGESSLSAEDVKKAILLYKASRKNTLISPTAEPLKVHFTALEKK